jgi:hypothetical protein
MRRMGKTLAAVPAAAAAAAGFRFPSEVATPNQAKALQDVVIKYRRLKIVDSLTKEGLPPEVIAGIVGVKVRTGYGLVRKAKSLEYPPDVELVLDVFLGMMHGTYAGVLGTRKSEISRWLFRLIAHHEPTEAQMRGRLTGRDDRDHFRRCHAAFLLDYREWSTRP